MLRAHNNVLFFFCVSSFQGPDGPSGRMGRPVSGPMLGLWYHSLHCCLLSCCMTPREWQLLSRRIENAGMIRNHNVLERSFS